MIFDNPKIIEMVVKAKKEREQEKVVPLPNNEDWICRCLNNLLNVDKNFIFCNHIYYINEEQMLNHMKKIEVESYLDRYELQQWQNMTMYQPLKLHIEFEDYKTFKMIDKLILNDIDIRFLKDLALNIFYEKNKTLMNKVYKQ